MSDNQESMHSDIRQNIYSLTEIAKYARVTTEFIQECERENLIHVTVLHGMVGYGHDTVRRLIRIRHLHRDLGLDLTAIDCILRMRRKIGHLQKQIHDMERRSLKREQELMAEIQWLRRQSAQDCNREIMWFPVRHNHQFADSERPSLNCPVSQLLFGTTVALYSQQRLQARLMLNLKGWNSQ